MSTRAKRPSYDWENHDGNIIPADDRSRSHLVNDDFKRMVKPYTCMLIFWFFLVMGQWEVQQSIFGENLLWYGYKSVNELKKSCLEKCIDNESLLTKNLTQKDKLCYRNCYLSSCSFYSSSERVYDKISTQAARGEFVHKV